VSVQHHFVVYGVEAEDGTMSFAIDDGAGIWPEGTLWDEDTEEWSRLELDDVEGWDRDTRLGAELERRLQGQG
jgi:hypothetical protein